MDFRVPMATITRAALFGRLAAASFAAGGGGGK